MKTTFVYSTKTSEAVIKYLKSKNIINENLENILKDEAKNKKTSVLNIFLEKTPKLKEKTAQLISHLNKLSYFSDIKDLSIKKHEDFKEENNFGAFMTNAGNEKILCLDPNNKNLNDLIKKLDIKDIKKNVISENTFNEIKKNFKKLTTIQSSKKSNIAILDDESDMGNANSFVYNMLKNCILMGASDIHIDLRTDEKGAMGFKLRFRVDGQCKDAELVNDIMLYRGIVNKLKLDSGLKIDERRIPQDGRISFDFNNKVYNFRLSFMPNTIRNIQEEKIVLRQMADVEQCSLHGLDILKHNIDHLEDAIKYPHGFICVTGPTGSGKTTLLYALLQQIDRTSKNVITLEDPIEAEIPLVNQSQMFHRIGYDFSSGLRVILRQDPDIIMVGEMRDEETALKAFEAANTGHLVFSTLHTNTAASSITRLLQMNIPYYFISSSLKYIVAQRLIRRVCPKCKKENPYAKDVISKIKESFKDSTKEIKELLENNLKNPQVFDPNIKDDNCSECSGVGYRGRMAIMEVMKVNDEIRKIINFENGNEDKIEIAAIKSGMLTIQQYGYLQVLKGLTTFEEVNNTVLSS